MVTLFLVFKALFSVAAAPTYVYRAVLGAGFSDPWAGAWKLGQERQARKRNTPSWFPSTQFFESSNDAYGRGTVFILNTKGWKPLFRKLHKNAAGKCRSQHTHSHAELLHSLMAATCHYPGAPPRGTSPLAPAWEEREDRLARRGDPGFGAKCKGSGEFQTWVCLKSVHISCSSCWKSGFPRWGTSCSTKDSDGSISSSLDCRFSVLLRTHVPGLFVNSLPVWSITACFWFSFVGFLFCFAFDLAAPGLSCGTGISGLCWGMRVGCFLVGVCKLLVAAKM